MNAFNEKSMQWTVLFMCLTQAASPNTTGHWGYKTFFMLNSAEHEIFCAHKCKNANNFWHFNKYEQEK